MVTLGICQGRSTRWWKEVGVTSCRITQPEQLGNGRPERWAKPAGSADDSSVVVRSTGQMVVGRLDGLAQQPAHVAAAGAVERAPPITSHGHQAG